MSFASGMNIQAIDTIFDGHRFRSRTEARWAVFFKTVGILYEYEKQGYNLGGKTYLPDFWLPEFEMWFEVKGQSPTQKEWELMIDLCNGTKKQGCIASGAPTDEFQCLWFNDTLWEWIEKFPFSKKTLWWPQLMKCSFAKASTGEFLFRNRAYLVPLKPALQESINGAEDYDLVSLAPAFEAAQYVRFEHGEAPHLRSVS